MKTINLLKKNKILLIIIMIIALIYPVATLSRIVYNVALTHFYKTKNFYFASDLLSEKNPTYEISNWSGVDSYVITINMNSILNEHVRATSNIDYIISFSCEDKVNCYLNKTNGTIPVNEYVDSNRDEFSLTIVPTKTFENNETTKVTIKAESTNPYKKSISATFTLKASKVGLSYEITDKKNDIFAILRLTNSLTYYTIKEAFNDFSVGDEIDQEKYNSLTEEEKLKCASLTVEINFDPRIITMDLTNSFYLKTFKTNPNNIKKTNLRRILKDFNNYKTDDLIDEDTYKKIDSSNYAYISDEFEYVSGIIINIDAISSGDIKFYKKDKYKDYTYPFVNTSSIVKVS